MFDHSISIFSNGLLCVGSWVLLGPYFYFYLLFFYMFVLFTEVCEFWDPTRDGQQYFHVGGSIIYNSKKLLMVKIVKTTHENIYKYIYTNKYIYSK